MKILLSIIVLVGEWFIFRTVWLSSYLLIGKLLLTFVLILVQIFPIAWAVVWYLEKMESGGFHD